MPTDIVKCLFEGKIAPYGNQSETHITIFLKNSVLFFFLSTNQNPSLPLPSILLLFLAPNTLAFGEKITCKKNFLFENCRTDWNITSLCTFLACRTSEGLMGSMSVFKVAGQWVGDMLASWQLQMLHTGRGEEQNCISEDMLQCQIYKWQLEN